MSTVSSDLHLKRLERQTLIVLVTMVVTALLWRPGSWRLAVGVAGGGVLIGLAYWGLRGLADVLVAGAIQGEIRSKSRGWALVKFFTRHAILASAAYGMIARLHLDPIGMLMGVSAPGIAVAVDALRTITAARRVNR